MRSAVAMVAVAGCGGLARLAESPRPGAQMVRVRGAVAMVVAAAVAACGGLARLAESPRPGAQVVRVRGAVAMVAVAAAAACGGLARLAESPRPGAQVATFRSDVDDTDQPYALYLPAGYDPSRRYPLLISLHAAASNHLLDLRRLFGRGNPGGETESEAGRMFASLPEVDYVVACPAARGSMGYRGIAEKDVYDLLDAVGKRFSIDSDRVYLAGIDMGGGGAMWLAMTRPDVWAGIAAICPEPPEGTAELAGNALNVPIELFQGELDPLVSAQATRTWHKVLLDENVRAEYFEYPNLRHNAWDAAYRNLGAFRMFDQARRREWPERVRFATRQYRHAAAYWVRLDRFESGTLASIDARFTARNRLEVTTRALEGFTLKLAGHPMLDQAPKAALVVTVDGVRLRVADPAAEVSFERAGALRPGAPAWRAGRGTPAADEKSAGREGPCAEALAGRHVYVYGTLASSGEEELERRRKLAQQAAQWSTPRSRLSLELRTISDRQVSQPENLRANLVLFGTRETNAVLERNAARLPFELNAGAADYGLLYAYPLEGRLALINSGLPWWTAGGGLEGTRGYAPERLRPLLAVPDFVLFRGSLEHVVVQGRFDRRWRLTPADARALGESGAVVVNQ